MARRFRGENIHKMDAKGRVSVPASFRRALAEGDPDYVKDASYQFVLVHSDRGLDCLEGYTIDAIDRIDDMIETIPSFSEEWEFLQNMLSAQSQYIPVEANGRFILPESVRDEAGLKAGDLMFVGVGSRFQIWKPEAYKDYKAALRAKFADRKGADSPLALLRPEPKGGVE